MLNVIQVTPEVDEGVETVEAPEGRLQEPLRQRPRLTRCSRTRRLRGPSGRPAGVQLDGSSPARSRSELRGSHVRSASTER